MSATLISGWNLVSSLGTKNNLNDLTNTPNNIVAVWGYDPSTGWAGKQTSDNLNHNSGYWIKCSASTTLTYPSSANIDSSVNLSYSQGWNLIALPYNEEKSLSNLLGSEASKVSNIWGYNSSSGWESKQISDTLNVNQGYWVKTTGAINATVTAPSTGPVGDFMMQVDGTNVQTKVPTTHTLVGFLASFTGSNISYNTSSLNQVFSGNHKVSHAVATDVGLVGTGDWQTVFTLNSTATLDTSATVNSITGTPECHLAVIANGTHTILTKHTGNSTDFF
tara:strand:+ start:2698 stop:3531 length:834 start_codon:yes stop_codon:yes gene_type:complete